MNKLEVFFFGHLIGHLIQEDALLSFTYTDEYLAKAHPRAISISLPLNGNKYAGSVVEAFFGGFLPEADIRDAFAKKLGVSTDNDFSLLNKIGGDCAGALAIGKSHAHSKRKLLRDCDLETFFKQTPARPLLSCQETRRMSLAGAQQKLAVLVEKGKIYLPASDEISTHIIKPVINFHPTSSHNEYFCLELARRLGLKVPQIKLFFAGEIPYLLIKRYDRDKQTRLHQEDFAQALGISYKSKYESECGFGYAQCFELVTNYCDQAAADKLSLLNLVLLNFIIGNNDAHLKNFSLLYQDRGRYIELAPCYDLLSTAIYPDLSSKMAMKLGKEYTYRRIRSGDWERFAQAIAVNNRYLSKHSKAFANEVLLKAELLAKELQKKYPSKVYAEIIACINTRRQFIF